MRSDRVGGQLTSKPLVPCFEKNKKTKMGEVMGWAADYNKKLKLMI